MPWNSTWPVGSVSVRNNRTTGNQNTTYIETTMGNQAVGTNTTPQTAMDHFWDVGANEDGRHRFIQSPAFTVGAVPTDPVIGTGMDGVQYLKTVLTRVQGFFRNAEGIYQYIPAFLSGSVAVNSTGTYSTVVGVPANCYGQIAMYTTALGVYSGVTAHFRSDATTVETWGLTQSDDTSSNNTPLKFASGGDALLLNIRARRSSAAAATWNYRITYREF